MAPLSAAKRRTALDVLPAGRLRALVDEFALVAENRRDRAALQQALSDGRRLAFSDLLQRLSRVELQQMCRALRQEDRGRSKQELIDRIVPPDVRGVARKAPAGARKRVSRKAERSAGTARKAVSSKASSIRAKRNLPMARQGGEPRRAEANLPGAGGSAVREPGVGSEPADLS
jgi:hypothetical protein